MTYHTVADVSALLKNITISDTEPGCILSVVQVTLYGNKTESDVLGELGKAYQLPIVQADSPLAFAAVKTICALFTAALCYNLLKLSGTIRIDPDEENKMISYYGMAKKSLENIMKDQAPLPDAVRLFAIEDTIRNTAAEQSAGTVSKALKQW